MKWEHPKYSIIYVPSFGVEVIESLMNAFNNTFSSETWLIYLKVTWWWVSLCFGGSMNVNLGMVVRVLPVAISLPSIITIQWVEYIIENQKAKNIICSVCRRSESFRATPRRVLENFGCLGSWGTQLHLCRWGGAISEREDKLRLIGRWTAILFYGIDRWLRACTTLESKCSWGSEASH